MEGSDNGGHIASILAGTHLALGEGTPITERLNLILHRSFRVTPTHKIGVQSVQLTLIAITWGGVKAGSCRQHRLAKDLTAIDAPRQLGEGISLKAAHHGARWEALSVPTDAVEPGTSL